MEDIRLEGAMRRGRENGRNMDRKLLTILVGAAFLLPITPIQCDASPFTVDGSTIYVNAGLVGIRTSTPTTVFDVNGDAQFGSGITKSTFSTTGDLRLASNAGLTLAGATAYGTFPASVTASSFWGDGAHLTNLPGGSGAASTRQVFLSGSNIYYSTMSTGNTPVQIKIRMIGGGGGGSCGAPGPGGNGGASSFFSVVASSGIGGTYCAALPCPASSGGTGGLGTASLRIRGGWGGISFDASGQTINGGDGGIGVFGGAGQGGIPNVPTGIAAVPNSGGGGGGCASQEPGSGGGAGEYVEIIITSPSASYPYVVGAGGVGKVASDNGGDGGSGLIIVDEFY